MLSFRLARPGCLAPSAPSAPPDVCLDGGMCLLHKDEFDEFFMSHADMNFVSPPHIHLSFRLSIPPVPAYQPAITMLMYVHAVTVTIIRPLQQPTSQSFALVFIAYLP